MNGKHNAIAHRPALPAGTPQTSAEPAFMNGAAQSPAPHNHARFQHEFTRALRDPSAPLPAGVEPHRAAIYRRLLRNNVAGFIDSCFPVLSEMLGTVRWQALIDEFFRDARCQSPLFRDIPESFTAWLTSAAGDDLPDWAFELADYEHAELRAEVHPAKVCSSAKENRPDWLKIPITLNPTAQLLSYRHPVHRYGPEEPPAMLADDASPICLIVWRDAGHDVRFMETSAATLLLLDPLAAPEAARVTGRVLLTTLAARIGQPDAMALEGHVLNLMQTLHDAGIVWPAEA